MTVSATDIQLGVCDVSFGGTDLGSTKGGVEVSLKTSTYEIKVDQAGDTPLKEIILGTMVEVKVPMAETNLTRLQSMMPQSVVSASAAAPTGAWAANGVQALGATTIVVTAGTGTPVAGHTFTFTGHSTVYRVVSYSAPNMVIVQHATGSGGLVTQVPTTTAMTFAAKTTGVEVRSGVNIDLVTGAAELLLHPTGDAGTTGDFRLMKAAPVPNFTFKYELGAERIYEVTFKGYVDTANNNRVARFGGT